LEREICMIKIFNKKKLFGNHIPPNCEYCRFNTKNNDGKSGCAYGTVGDTCKKYEYDPLKREPRTAPALPEFAADDFTL